MSSHSSSLRSLFESAGAAWIEVPVLHPAEPFLETAGEDIRRRMFVTEGPTGERLALRPDFTIPVCLEHLRSGAGAERYAYEGVVFRRHDSGSPERLETGFEDIGRSDQAKADAEALALAVAAVATIMPEAPSVRLGDIGLFAALLEALDLPPAWQQKLRRSFGVPALMSASLARLQAPRAAEDPRLDPEIAAAADRHDLDALAALLDARRMAHGHAEGVGRTASEIAQRFLGQRALSEAQIGADALKTLGAFLALEVELSEADAALAKFCSGRGLALGAALTSFADRAAAIEDLRPPAPIRFEAGFGRPLDYYTGLVFEVRAAGLPFPVTGGGRYDRLMQLLGADRPIPAVGFTMRLDLGERSSQ